VYSNYIDAEVFVKHSCRDFVYDVLVDQEAAYHFRLDLQKRLHNVVSDTSSARRSRGRRGR
jgi:hypothetical protein